MTVDPLAAALHSLAGVFGDGMTAMHVGGKFTCSEAEIIADVLIESGHVEAAEEWLHGHAMGDDGSDDMHGICRHCDALLLLNPDDGAPWATDVRGNARCFANGGNEHEATSWTLVGEDD